MATLSSDRVTQNLPARNIHAGVFTECAEYSGAAALSASDVIQMVRVQPGTRVVDVWLGSNVISSANTTLAIGDGGDADRYVSAAATTFGHTFTAKTTALNYEYTASDTVDITVRAAGANQTGAPKLVLFVSMVVDN